MTIAVLVFALSVPLLRGLPLEPGQWAFWLVLFAPVILAVFPTVQIFRYARRL